MGSRVYYWAIKSLHILILSAALNIFMGCPNPNKHIWFANDHKLVEEIKLRFVAENISIRLFGQSALGGEFDEYHLQIWTDLRFPRNLKNDVRLYPENMYVYFGGHLMKRDSTYFIPFEDSLEVDKSFNTTSFAYDLSNDTLIIAAVRKGKGVDLKIIMDNFIYYKGEPLHIDTILAVEKQPFLY